MININQEKEILRKDYKTFCSKNKTELRYVFISASKVIDIVMVDPVKLHNLGLKAIPNLFTVVPLSAASAIHNRSTQSTKSGRITQRVNGLWKLSIPTPTM